MSSLSRWMFSVVAIVAFAFSASAQSLEAFSPARRHVAVVTRELGGCHMQRTVLYEDIAHYTCTVRVGTGEHDVIMLHRIVREERPNRPADLEQAVMFFPGSPTYFMGLYVPPSLSPVPPRDRSIAIYLAQHDIDVWGMDYRWALVPESTTEFGFMKNWGVTTDVQDGQVALTLARHMRGTSREPAGPLFVSGLSYGAQVSYGIAANDSQRASQLRNVKGIIPLDCGVKYKEPDSQAQDCANVDYTRGLLDSGVYADDNRAMDQIGQLAIDAPTDTSPFAPPLTNYQFDLVVATSPQGAIPWHFAGGYFDNTGMPTGLRFTEVRTWMDLLAKNEPPYSPVQVDHEQSAANCGTPEPNYSDHLGQIRVPIFLVGAGGGFGHYSDYTTTLTASHDVTIHIVQLLSDDRRSEDYGHADLLEAYNAPYLVWPVILQWIQAHP